MAGMLRFPGLPRACRGLLAGPLLAVSALAGAEPLSVFAGVEPVRYLAQAVGGERVTAHVLVPPGQNPHAFEPTPRQLAALEASRIYLAVGMPFEAAWVPRLRGAAPDLEVVELAESGPAHDHGPHGADPHPWTDPLAARKLAGRIRDALAEADPDGRPGYEERFRSLAGELAAAHREMTEVLAPVRGRPFVVYHPAWGALARRYGLVQLAVESEGKSPGGRHLAELITEARDAGVCAVFVQPQISTRAAERVAEAVDVPVLAMDPLAGDLPRHLPRVARTLARHMERPCPR